MEVPLTPLEFARRSRRLHGDREAVVDGTRRLTYEQFFDRCDRFSSALQALGVSPGDRVATIASNSLAHLEAFYAVPQIGAVLVPINYRLTGDDVAYILEHSGARVVCADAASCELVDSIRAKTPGVGHRVALDGPRPGWLDYEAELRRTQPAFRRPPIGEGDLLSLNYTSGTTARQKGVMITHRNAYFNVVGTLLHLPMAVDSNVLVFERIREELRNGRAPKAAIENGFSKAFATIVDTHATAIIAAVFLLQFGTGPVKGFAVTLIIGLLISMFTAVFVSHTIFELEYGRRAHIDAVSI